MKKMNLFLSFAVSCLICGCSSEKSFEISGADSCFNGTVDGVSQKGPFLTGSTVTLQELDVKSLEQTGKSFKGKIVNDNGEFVIDNVDLSSPYALLVTNGYFRNEVTGKNSNGTIIMMAVVDVSNRSHVNINLLTHLDYERVRVLLEREKMSFVDAKNKAKQEIFSNFFDMSASENAESLDIFGESEGDKALLAINVLLLGGLSEPEFMERLILLSEDLSRDGVWDDSLLKTKIADYACELEFMGRLPKVRENIESWEIGDVPAFEPYINRFWANQYGLGKCDATNAGERKKNINAASAFYNMNFVCDVDSGWIAAMEEYGAGCESCAIMKDSRDGNVYKYMNIDGTDWMMSNIRFNSSRYRCEIYDDHDIASVTPICPSGWRIPTNDDFNHLMKSASEDEIKLLFSESERMAALAEGDTLMFYLSSSIVEKGIFRGCRYALSVLANDSLFLSFGISWQENTYVRCVKDLKKGE